MKSSSILSLLALLGLSAMAQPEIISSARLFPASAHIIVPQARNLTPAEHAVEVIGVTASLDIIDQFATTTLDVILTNRGTQRLESRMLIPVPDGALLKGFDFQGAAAEPAAKLLPREEARQIYDSIVAATRDPALLEFLGFNVIQSSVFPVEPRSGQRVRIIYEQLLSREGDRVDYAIPRTESIDYRVPWKINLRIRSNRSIATVYSPSHGLNLTRRNASDVLAEINAEAEIEPGPFRLAYLSRRSELAATLLAYPDPAVSGGYFLLLAGAPARPADAKRLKREVILVLDRSGSMAGEKLGQARAAALQVLESLEPGESFNLIVYSEMVELFSIAPVEKNDETMRSARNYLRGLRARGGTNIHDALQEALRMRWTSGTLPLVLFLTDGLPTVGQTSERAIQELIAQGNPHKRRIFTFGVGVDVNTPLLDKVALLSRATSTFVLPREDVEVKVGQVFQRLFGPVLSEPELSVLATNETPALARTRELLPGRLPDLFEGDQLVVLGQYTGDDPLVFILRGSDGERERAYRFEFTPRNATTKNAFVPRLWAARKIALLTDAIRDLGADSGRGGFNPPNNPRFKELVEEVIRLSREFGILSGYTAFLAREGTDLARPELVLNEALKNFDDRGVKTRSGLDSVSQSINNDFKRAQVADNYRNKFYDAQMKEVEITSIQQVNNHAFYKRGNRWIDSRLVENRGPAPRVVQFGSEEFRRLAERLASEGRQGTITLKGEVLLQVGGETILIR